MGELREDEKLTAKEKETGNGESDAKQALPRSWLVKEDNASDGHDSCSTGEDDRYRRERTSALKEQKEYDSTSADADASERGIPEARETELLIPAPVEVKKREIARNAESGDALDNEAAEAFADACGSEARKNLMRAVEDSGNNCIPEPRCHSERIGEVWFMAMGGMIPNENKISYHWRERASLAVNGTDWQAVI